MVGCGRRHTCLQSVIEHEPFGLGLSNKLGDSKPAYPAPSLDWRGHTGAFDRRTQTSLAWMAWEKSTAARLTATLKATSERPDLLRPPVCASDQACADRSVRSASDLRIRWR